MPSLLVCLLAAMLSGCAYANAQGSVPDTPAARQAKETAPQLFVYTDNVLFGDLWMRADLSPRDRSLVTLSSLIANGQSAQMTSHVTLALNNGLTPREIVGVITHLAFYTGWPSAMSALSVAKGVFDARGLDAAQYATVVNESLDVDDVAEASRIAIIQAEIAPIAPNLARYTNDVLFDDEWRQADLTLRDRSLVTVVALIAHGQIEQLPFYLNRAMDSGVTQTQLTEVVTHLAFYAGWPRAMSTLPVLHSVFAERK